jgi:peroxiredoxin
VPDLAGEWTIGVKSPKGETAWRFLVTQQGPDVSAAILRVDGDTGTLTGRFVNGSLLLSHFSGGRPLRLEVTVNADGSLTLVPNGKDPLVAVRAGSARAADLGTPADPTRHTRLKVADEPLRFSAPDLDGHIVSNTDARFTGRVVLVNISGSWCPNCHDEAPFLAQLSRTYKARGLEIVTLTFEEAEQLANPTRLKAFIKTHGVEFPVLLAGEPSQLADKVPQAEHLDAWPTTFVIGREGRVRSVHAGFPSPASGAFHTQAVRALTDEVEQLLAEPARGSF